MSIQQTESKVFGIGYSRTGTTSLAAALALLGYKTIHAPLSIIRRKDGELVLDPTAVRRYEAMTDISVALMYGQLDTAFPGAKFVLTTRNVERWLTSMERVREIAPLLRLGGWLIPKVSQLICAAFGDSEFRDEEVMRIRFSQHTRDVLAHFQGRDDLLVMDITKGDGWEKLCGFLGRPAPNIPFPHHNNQTVVSWSNILDTARGLA